MKKQFKIPWILYIYIKLKKSYKLNIKDLVIGDLFRIVGVRRKEKTYRMREGWKIEMFTLRGCDKCEMLKTGLRDNGIPFTEIDITSNSILGDKLEEIYQCSQYPMVSFKGNHQIIWLPESFSLPSPNIKIYNSIVELIEQIKYYLK
jgi:glutaredoxin